MFSAVLEMMSCSKGSLASSGLLKLDEEKQYHRRRRSSEEQKSARKRRRAIRKGFADTIQQAEVVTYIAGGFSECQKLVFFWPSDQTLVHYISRLAHHSPINLICRLISGKFPRC